MAPSFSSRRSQAGGRGHERRHRCRLFQGPDQTGQAPDRRGRQDTRLWRGRWMVLETRRPRNHPLIASKDSKGSKGSKECRPATCAIFAGFCAIYRPGTVVSRPGDKTATAATNGKTGLSKERPYRRPRAREERRVAIGDYLIASPFHSRQYFIFKANRTGQPRSGRGKNEGAAYAGWRAEAPRVWPCIKE
jgi:hypothetical protein